MDFGNDLLFNVQCISGHVSTAKETQVDRCLCRESEGYLDALMISYEECPECIQEGLDRASKFINDCNLMGCLMEDMKMERLSCDECSGYKRFLQLQERSS
ncbi:MAG: hypothetical protein KAS32_01745 [Candidatus Peribacteraceae bacterium]|nr:hypothetical protein [Candidatus Peribacteraceae bacterium]